MKKLKLTTLLLIGGLGLSIGPTQADVGADPGLSQGSGGASGSAMRSQMDFSFESESDESCGDSGGSDHEHEHSASVERTSRETALEADEWMKRSTARETSARQNAKAGGDKIMGAIAGAGSSEVQRHSDSKDPAFERSGPGRDRR